MASSRAGEIHGSVGNVPGDHEFISISISVAVHGLAYSLTHESWRVAGSTHPCYVEAGPPGVAPVPCLGEALASGWGCAAAQGGWREIPGGARMRLHNCLFVQYDAAMSIDQIAFSVPVAIAVWLSQSRSEALRRWACLFGLAGMPYWLYAGAAAGQWGMLGLASAFSLAWVRGLWVHWLAPRRRQAMHSGLGTLQITPGTR